jgi:hypothetical protein
MRLRQNARSLVAVVLSWWSSSSMSFIIGLGNNQTTTDEPRGKPPKFRHQPPFPTRCPCLAFISGSKHSASTRPFDLGDRQADRAYF